MHALTTHHPFSSYSFNNSLVPVPSPFPNPSTPTTTTQDRTLPRRSPSPNPGIPWNHSFATSLFPTNPPQTTSACPAAAMANPQPSTIPLNEAGVLMRSEIGPHRSRDYFNCQPPLKLKKLNQSNQQQQLKLLLRLPQRPPLHLKLLISQTVVRSRHQTIHLKNIPLTLVADFSANIRSVFANLLAQFHPCQSFTVAATALVEKDGEKGSGDIRMEVDDIGSVDVRVTAEGNKKKREKKKAAFHGVEEISVEETSEKVHVVVELESSSGVQIGQGSEYGCILERSS